MSDDRSRREGRPVAGDEYRRLFEDSRDAIYLGTVDGRLLDINPAGVQLFGYSSKEDMLSLDIATDLYWNPEDRKQVQAEFLAKGFIKDLEIELRTRSGQRILVRESASAIYDDDGKICGSRGILHDITEHRQLENQFRQAQKMEAIGRLAEGVAHDFNNLLTAINGYSELILVQISEESPVRAAVSEIRRAGTRAAELTRRLLTLSRHQTTAPRKLDLNEVVAEIEKLLRRVIGEQVVLETILDRGLPPILADRSQIEQVILNLAINARDAMPDGGRLTLETARRELSDSSAGWVLLMVSDTGGGMNEVVREHLFEPFFTTKERAHNSGLGLAIVYGIVQQCGGRINVESTAGSGSTFRLTFPPADIAGTESATSVASQQSVVLPTGNETVLLVEDEDSVRDLVQKILEIQGYRVLAAQDAQAAFEICGRLAGPLDLLLTDVVMPATSGPILAERLQERYRDLKVLFMSGYTDSHSGVRLLNQRRAAFLPKPFSPEVLAHKVREVLDGDPTSF